MRYELKSIPLWPVTRVAFFVNLVVGFVVGIMYAVFLIPIVAMLSNIAALESGNFDMQAAPVGVLMMIVPFFSALSSAFFGTLFIVIIVLVYNLVTRMTGGIELNLQQLDQQAAAPAPAGPTTTAAPPTSVGPPPPPPPPVSQPQPPPPPKPEDVPPPTESPKPGSNRPTDEDTTV